MTHAVLVVWSISGERKLPTVDEPIHLTQGYIHWTDQSYEYGKGNPPLTPMVITVPLLFLKPILPPDWQEKTVWETGERFLDKNVVPMETMIWWGRVMIVPFSLGLGLAVYRWAGILGGTGAGLAALAAYVFDPNILARAGSTASDIPVSCFMFMAVWTMWRWFVRPRARTAAFAGLWIGLAAASKYTALVLGPTVIVLYLLARWAKLPGASPKECIKAVVLGFLVAQVPLILVYQAQAPWTSWLDGLRISRSLIFGGGQRYFMGVPRNTPIWYYYFVSFIIKTPLPLLLALFGGGVLAVVRGRRVVRDASSSATWSRPRVAEQCALLALPATLMAAATVTPVQAGIRYVLPMYPFLCVLVGLVGATLARWAWGRVGVGLLAAWLVFGTIRVFPGYPFYYNELVGGPEKGWWWLQDSDVNMNVKAVKDYVRREHFGTVIFAGYGWGARKPTFDVRPGAGLVSAKPEEWAQFDTARVVMFVPVIYYAHVWIRERPFAWLHQRKPVALVGYSELAFDLTNDPEGRQIAGLR